MGEVLSEDQALLALAKELLRSVDYEQTLDVIVHRTMALLHAERGFLVLVQDDTFDFKVIRNWSPTEYQGEREPISRTIVREVLQREQPLLLEDASRDKRFQYQESVRRLGIRSVLAAPLFVGGGAEVLTDERLSSARRDAKGPVGISAGLSERPVGRLFATANGEPRFVHPSTPQHHLVERRAVGVLYVESRSIQRPFQQKQLSLFQEILEISNRALSTAVERLLLLRRNELLERDLLSTHRFPGIITRDAGLLKVLETAAKVATSELPVLIQGASGTGKELIARAIHLNSARAKRPFIVVNCGAISPLLLESELFGHLRGAFTGAIANKDGLLTAAHRGTLLLDEVSELPKELQVKLLRTIQFGEIQPVGSTQTQVLDVRFIAATNKNVEEEVSQGRFREDLFYRLNAVTLFLPPLRERPGDILLLFRHFLQNAKANITQALERCIEEYHWPGNIRELENEAKRLLALYDTEPLRPEMLSPRVWQKRSIAVVPGPLKSLLELEREAILQHIQAADGNRTRASETLGITREGLRQMLKRHALD